jgi:hypothetical protein
MTAAIPPSLNGWLRPDGLALTGVLTDAFGYETHITAQPFFTDGRQTGWTLAAHVVIPDGLKVPFVDDEAEP